ncbi:MAG: class I SAM-dependent methyltransferase [Acidisphaera sp.]|nr:class I SAM-dependent methyltransferase [Acidisphaera sp.]
MTARYYPEIYDAADLRRAKEIILTDEGPGADTDTRWAVETPYILELLGQAFELRPEMLLLDYGCGIGRMARAIIETAGCSVIGVDTSPRMRRLAEDYVGSERFVACSPAQFDTMVAAGLRVHAAIAIWVLQHCLTPAADIERIRRGLAAGGQCFVVNMLHRAVPALRDADASPGRFVWVNDGQDIAALLRQAFEVAAEGEPDASRVPKMAQSGVFWMHLRR